MSNFSRKISRDKRYPPAPLQRLIDFVNSVRPEVPLPAVETEGTKILRLLKSEPFERFRELIGGLEPDSSLQKLYGPGAPKTFIRVAGCYNLLRNGRQVLNQVARIGSFCREIKPRGWQLSPLKLPIVTAQLDERGKLRLNLGPIIDAINGIDPSRVRICAICQAFCWGRRTDTKCCSEECHQKFRNQNWTKDYPDKHKQERIKRAVELDALGEARERERLAGLKAATRGTGRREPRLPKGPKHK